MSMDRDPHRDTAERLLAKVREFAASLDDDERALFATLIAPGVARAYQEDDEVVGGPGAHVAAVEVASGLAQPPGVVQAAQLLAGAGAALGHQLQPQALAQPAPRPMEGHLRRAGRHAERDGEIVGGQPDVGGQRHGGGHPVRQPGEAAAHQGRHLVQLRRLLRVGFLVRHGGGHLLGQVGGAGVRAHVVDSGAARDRHQPCPDRAGVDLVQRGEGVPVASAQSRHQPRVIGRSGRCVRPRPSAGADGSR